jgi:hypothetical protein
MPESDRDRLIGESAESALALLRSSGAIEYPDVSAMYKVLEGQWMLVRREDPSRIFDLVTHQEPITIDFPEGERYSNAVEWTPTLGAAGLQNAYNEGYGQLNTVVMVAGFRNSGSIDVQALPDAAHRFAGLDRTHVRSIKGEVQPEDVLFVTLRIPSNAFPDSEMTDNEYERHHAYTERKQQGDAHNPAFIYRGFLFSNNLKKQ